MTLPRAAGLCNGATVTGDYFKGLERLSAALPQPLARKMLVYAGCEEHSRRDVVVTNTRGFAASLAAIAEELGAGDRRR